MDRFAPLQIRDFDHLELAVADLEKGATPWLRLGFEKIASRDIAERRLKSYLLGLNHAFVLISASSLRTDPVSKFVQAHGDGVFNIAFRCEDAVAAIDIAANRGAEVLDTPKYYQREFGSVHSATIRAPGDLRHTFVSRKGNLFAEGFEVPIKAPRRPAGIRRIEEAAIAVETGKLEAVAAFYEKTLGLRRTESLTGGEVRSCLLQSPGGLVPLRLNEPLAPKNPVQDFLEVHHGSGVHYASFTSENLLATLRPIRREGVAFRSLPANENSDFEKAGIPVAEAREVGVRVETNGEGWLLHSLTKEIAGGFFVQLAQRQAFPGLGQRGFENLLGSLAQS